MRCDENGRDIAAYGPRYYVQGKGHPVERDQLGTEIIERRKKIKLL